MHISVIGAGYVGLVTGTCFAEFGNDVICVDKNVEKVSQLEAGKMPIYEPGLDVLVAKNVKDGRLTFTADIKSAIENSLVIFIAVGTPSKPNGAADLTQVESVAKDIAQHINGYKVIVNKSTVPAGSARWITEVIDKNVAHRQQFSVISNPEFLRQGSAIEDFMRPNRVVIGSDSSEATAIMKELYSPLYLIETPFVITNIESAELIKYASNAFLATKISFINEIANFCDKIGADAHHVALGMGLDKRIGKKFLHAGPGFGGSCFPKDTQALLSAGQQWGLEFKILDSVIKVNNNQINIMLDKIRGTVDGGLKGKNLGILGLSFKPNTDDMRTAPATRIISGLLSEGATVKAFDPVAMKNARKLFPQLTCCKDTYETAKNCDALIFITEWNQFRSLDLDRIKGLMKSPIIIDLRNIYDPQKMFDKGFDYVCIGRPSSLYKNRS